MAHFIFPLNNIINISPSWCSMQKVKKHLLILNTLRVCPSFMLFFRLRTTRVLYQIPGRKPHILIYTAWNCLSLRLILHYIITVELGTNMENSKPQCTCHVKSGIHTDNTDALTWHTEQFLHTFSSNDCMYLQRILAHIVHTNQL